MLFMKVIVATFDTSIELILIDRWMIKSRE